MITGNGCKENKIVSYLGQLNHNQRTTLIDLMEKEIIQDKKVYDDEYFKYLQQFLIENRDNAMTFKRVKECEYYIEKLEWIRKKNVIIKFYEKEDKLLAKIRTALPKEFHRDLIELVDSCNNREIELYFNYI